MAWRRQTSADHVSAQRVRGRSDPEKARLSGDEDGQHQFEDDRNTFSPASSRSAGSNQPMLATAFRNTRSTPSMMIRLPNSIMRWLCWGLAVAMLVFVFSLVRMSWKSDEILRIAILKDKQSPKPAVWESFPFLQRYYGGIRSLVPRSLNEPEYPDGVSTDANTTAADEAMSSRIKRAIMDTVVFDPYPNYASSEYIEEYGTKVDCFLDEAGLVNIPRVRIYEAVPKGFPDSVMGSADLLGLRNDICYDRFGRLGPYGLGYSLRKGGSGAMEQGEREGADSVWSDYPEVDFGQVKWAAIQERCVQSNAHRFEEMVQSPLEKCRLTAVGASVKEENLSPFLGPQSGTHEAKVEAGKSKLPRSAVVIRTWSDYDYTIEDVMYLRSIISELSVLSGGEYVVHFLIQVKDDNLPIWSDPETYARVLRDALPAEFEGMGTLWTEPQMGLFYGGLEESWMRDLPVHGVYRSTFMPMQYFAHQHPEYDYFWNWEMDVRNTGHWYHFFDTVTRWAKKQPRKYLWERNSRYYIPSEHGSWEEFSHTVRVQTEEGTNSVNNIWSGLGAGKARTNAQVSGDKPIWGPERPADDPNTEFDEDPKPPTTMDKDKYEWGVGEDADLITFNPLFDPVGTTWLLRDDTTGYKTEKSRLPRRTAVITASRLSRRLLATMHRETSLNRHTMFSEMWPASCALHHGLKAVYVPQPMYIDRRWPTDYLKSVFNAGRNGATGAARTSVFGEREHNFRGTSWYYNAAFPDALWHRWIGLKIHNDGGEMWELAGEGRMCLPPMMIHPIKRIDLPQEGKRD